MTIARTSPPAKLNLFLEIPARRHDGYHAIDTVMTAIDWRDELTVESVADPQVTLTADWLPSAAAIADQLGLDHDKSQAPELLRIPTGPKNLVVMALEAFRRRFGIRSGFHATLEKRIPAGAGMGGASSDAAHAISCAAQIHQLTNETKTLHEIAASIGSDVPFFLPTGDPATEIAVNAAGLAAHATGRGERITPLQMRTSIHFVVAYPAVSLSTAAVYGRLIVPERPVSSSLFRAALQRGDVAGMSATMMNRLSEPALEILPQLGDLLESLWQSGLQPCQLTGSGSACYGIANDGPHAQGVVKRLLIELQPGVLLRAARTVSAAAPIEIEPS